jgi:hypothetical protein
MDAIIKQFLGFVQNKTARLGVEAVIVATLLAAVVIVILSLGYDEGIKFNPARQDRIFVAGIFLVVFLISWFIFRLLDVTDIYTDVRYGDWVVVYDSGPVSEQTEIQPSTIECRIEQNQQIETTDKVYN